MLDGSPGLLEFFRHQYLLFRTFDYGDSAPTVRVWWAVPSRLLRVRAKQCMKSHAQVHRSQCGLCIIRS
jgi:hypothetical protein